MLRPAGWTGIAPLRHLRVFGEDAAMSSAWWPIGPDRGGWQLRLLPLVLPGRAVPKNMLHILIFITAESTEGRLGQTSLELASLGPNAAAEKLAQTTFLQAIGLLAA